MNPLLFSLQALGPVLETYRPPPAVQGGGTRFVMDRISLLREHYASGKIQWEVGEDSLRFSIDRPAEDGSLTTAASAMVPAGESFGFFSENTYQLEPDFWRIRAWQGRHWLAPLNQRTAVHGMSERRLGGTCKGDQIVLVEDEVSLTLPIVPPLSDKWVLLEAARRLAGVESHDVLEFSCLDEGDQVHPGHRLTPGDWVADAWGMRLRPFLHTGAAQIPRVIWVDESRRPIVFASGLETALLASVDEAKADYQLAKRPLTGIRLPTEFAR